MASSKPAVRTYNLRQFRELRILNDVENNSPQINNKQMPTVKLLSTNVERGKKYNDKVGVNTAEIFGMEMLIDNEYIIKPNARLAIYTWSGCTLQVRGHITQEYDAPNNAMKEYLNFAYILDARREIALLNNKIGPTVLVVGASSSGKSSICNILCNYALKTGWNPTYIELDPRCSTDKEQLGFLPGVIGATVIETFEDKEPEVPLCYYLGSMDVNEQQNLFLQQCECLSAAVHMHFAYNLKNTVNIKKKNKNTDGIDRFTAASGMIINGPYMPSTNIIGEIVEIFNVDIILVIDNPSLQFNLEEKFNFRIPEKDEDFPHIHNNIYFKNTYVVGLPKLDGVVSVDNERLRYIRRNRWKKYFNGEIDNPIRPFFLRIRFTDFNFVILDTFASLSNTSLVIDKEKLSPLLSEEKKNEIAVLDWHGSPRTLLNVVLGIPSCTNKYHISTSNIAGFVYVKNVEEIESTTKGSAEDIEGNEENNKTEIFVLDLWAPHLNEGKLFSNFLLVPSDLRQMKWIPDA